MHDVRLPRYSSPLDAVLTIWREEGLRLGLYRGLSLNYLKTLPNVAIYMSLYDIAKLWLSQRSRGGGRT